MRFKTPAVGLAVNVNFEDIQVPELWIVILN
jgi:hypothetical protein